MNPNKLYALAVIISTCLTKDSFVSRYMSLHRIQVLAFGDALERAIPQSVCYAQWVLTPCEGHDLAFSKVEFVIVIDDAHVNLQVVGK